jgi:hypothetical protein
VKAGWLAERALEIVPAATTYDKSRVTRLEDPHHPTSDFLVWVTIDGRPASPFMGFASWAAFTPGPGGTMVMGDIVLLEDEVSPTMSAALDNGLEVTALHNHFFYEQPRVMYMHIGGSGDVAKLGYVITQPVHQELPHHFDVTQRHIWRSSS